MDGGLSLFGEILISTSPAKFGWNLEKQNKIFVTEGLCYFMWWLDRIIEKIFVNAFVQIELCHMKNAILATIFNTLINLALVTFKKQRSQ